MNSIKLKAQAKKMNYYNKNQHISSDESAGELTSEDEELVSNDYVNSLRYCRKPNGPLHRSGDVWPWFCWHHAMLSVDHSYLVSCGPTWLAGRLSVPLRLTRYGAWWVAWWSNFRSRRKLRRSIFCGCRI